LPTYAEEFPCRRLRASAYMDHTQRQWRVRYATNKLSIRRRLKVDETKLDCGIPHMCTADRAMSIEFRVADGIVCEGG